MASTGPVLQICRLTPLYGMDLFKEISQSYDTVTTVFLSGKAQPELQGHYNGEVIFFEVDHHSFFWRINAFFKLYRLCKKNKFDLIITHHYKPTLIMHYVLLFCPVKKRYSVHHNFGNFQRKPQQWMLCWLKKSWKFITVSDALKKEFMALGVPENKIITIHNCLDISRIKALSKEDAREKLALPLDAFIFGTLGRLVRGKGHSMLIEAFKNINIPAHLVIIGTGPLEKTLREHITALGLGNRVSLITDPAIAHKGAHNLKALDIFVFPSLREAFGLVLLEAAYAGLPIIASDAGGIPEAAPFAIFFPAGDVQSLTELLKNSLLSPPKAMPNSFTLENYRQSFNALGLP